jgi:predicted Zn-dependent protease
MDPLDRRFRAGGRLLTAGAMALVAMTGYLGIRSYAPIATLAARRVAITPPQEIALGLQAAPSLAQRYGGLSSDQAAQGRIDRVCHELVEKTSARATPYDFDCHLLADERTIDAFSLPGGQVFLTAGLLARLQTDGQLAGVLAHEIGHVVARHGVEHIAGFRLARGVTGAAALARYDPANPESRRNATVAALIGQLVDLRFSRPDELEADRLGVRLLSEAGWDPRGMIQAARLLQASPGDSRPPELFSTHPNPENRIGNLETAIRRQYPRGVPGGMRS